MDTSPITPTSPVGGAQLPGTGLSGPQLRSVQPPQDPPRQEPPPGSGIPFADSASPFLRRWGGVLGLLALCLVLFLPGLFVLPPFDRDEARFAQASRQMLESGDFVEIRFQDEPRNKKPIGIYWAQAASASLFGGQTAPIWAHRLPSTLSAIAAVLLVFWGARRLFEDRTAFLAASLLAVSLLTVVEAHLAKTDAAMLAATCAAQMAAALLYVRSRDAAALPQLGGAAVRWGLPLLFWTALGIGVLLKGPVTPMVTLLTLLALAVADRSARWMLALRPLIGLPLAALIVAPWFIAVTQATDGTFVASAVQQDLLPKLIGGHESHGAPPGLYLALLPLCFFPGVLFLVPALREAWANRVAPETRFALAWLIPSWLVFEAIPTKLPHYVLPMYPALALIVAALVMDRERRDSLARWWARLPLALWAIVPLALAGIAVGAPWYLDGGFSPASVIPALVALVGGGLALRFAWQTDAHKAILAGIATATLTYGMILETVLPRIDGFWLSRSAAEMLVPHREGRETIASAGYTEPSLVFLLGTETILTGGQGAAEALAAGAARYALVADRERDAFQSTLTARGVAAEAIDARRGYNYSKGRWVTLALYRRTGP